MGLPQTQLLCTPDEYLAFEREATERHEWLDGLIYAMAGESPQHSLIIANLIAILNLQLRGKPCRVFSPNMKVYSCLPTDTTMKGLFSYPDTLVVCGQPRFHDQHGDVVVNPTVIVEVLSKSIEAYDRGEKFERYSQNASLTDYLLVSQRRPKIKHYTRNEHGRWSYSRETSLAGSLYLATIDCRLPLAEVYDGIEFPPPSELTNPLEPSSPGAG